MKKLFFIAIVVLLIIFLGICFYRMGSKESSLYKAQSPAVK